MLNPCCRLRFFEINHPHVAPIASRIFQDLLLEARAELNAQQKELLPLVIPKAVDLDAFNLFSQPTAGSSDGSQYLTQSMIELPMTRTGGVLAWWKVCVCSPFTFAIPLMKIINHHERKLITVTCHVIE